MHPQTEFVSEFFRLLNIAVEIERKEHWVEATIPTAAFGRQQPLIERWFTVLKQDEERTVLRERLRGGTIRFS